MIKNARDSQIIIGEKRKRNDIDDEYEPERKKLKTEIMKLEGQIYDLNELKFEKERAIEFRKRKQELKDGIIKNALFFKKNEEDLVVEFTTEQFEMIKSDIEVCVYTVNDADTMMENIEPPEYLNGLSYPSNFKYAVNFTDFVNF